MPIQRSAQAAATNLPLPDVLGIDTRGGATAWAGPGRSLRGAPFGSRSNLGGGRATISNQHCVTGERPRGTRVIRSRIVDPLHALRCTGTAEVVFRVKLEPAAP